MQTHLKHKLLFLVLFIANFGFAQQPVKLIDQGDNVVISKEYVQVTLARKKHLSLP